MRLKTRVLASVSALALTGSIAALAAPAAHAAVVSKGSCTGSVSLSTLTPALGDQTQAETAVVKYAKDITTLAVKGGTCDNTSVPANAPSGQPPATLHPKAEAAKLTGYASCASGATAIAADATKANAYELNGPLTITMTETYTLPSGVIVPWKIAAQIAVLGFNPAGVDVIDVGGIVLKGADVGDIVGGSLWEDPVSKAPAGIAGTDPYNIGYNLDISTAGGCADGIPNNASIPLVEVGGGGATTTSLFGSSATGLLFHQGE